MKSNPQGVVLPFSVQVCYHVALIVANFGAEECRDEIPDLQDAVRNYALMTPLFTLPDLEVGDRISPCQLR